MSRRQYWTTAALVLAVLLALIPACRPAATPTPAPAATPKPTPAKVWELKFQTYAVPGKDARWVVPEHWAKLVEEKTGGRVKVTVYPQNALVTVKEMIPATGKGVIDLFLSNEFYVAGKYPALGWAFLPGAIPDWKTDFYALWDTEIWDIIDGLFARDNLKLVWAWNGGPIIAFPMRNSYVKKMEDFKGRKVRGAGGLINEFLKVMGAAVTPIPGPEVYTALQTGVVDGAVTSIDTGVVAWKFYEPAPYVSYAPHFPMNSWTVFVAMNLDVWKELPPDVQQAILDVGKSLKDEAIRKVEEDIQRSLDTLKEKGIEVYIIPKEETDRWLPVLKKPLWDWYLGKSGETGKKITGIIEKYLAGK